jgi:serine/threonine protein kinase
LAKTTQPADSTADPSGDRAPGRSDAIGRYLVLHLMGKGAMGEVYAAYDPELDRKVAIKLWRGTPGDDAEAAEGRRRMMREAQAIAKLSHPNVVVVYDVGAFQNQVFVAMEFVEGHTLGYWLHAQRRAWPDVLKVFAEAGRGLAAAHEKGLIHRDFKPENVMVSPDGQVRVMDFGLARAIGRAPKAMDLAPAVTDGAPSVVNHGANPDHEDIDSTRSVAAGGPDSHLLPERPSTGLGIQITQTGAIIGTPAYMSPEQFLGRDTDARTDQFSFCVALYQGLYGERPYAGQTHKVVEASVLKGHIREPPRDTEVPAWLRKLVLRGLRTDPDERWPSMNVLLAELERSRLFARRRRFANGAAAKLSDIWPAPVRGRPVETETRAEMRKAFLATNTAYAATSFDNVSRILDAYAESWSDMYTEICEATHVHAEQSVDVFDLRMSALMELLDGLRAVCQIFRQATPDVVVNAVGAVSALGSVQRCADIKLLRTVVRPPEDQLTRGAVDHLRARLAEVRVLCQVGRLNDGLKAIAAIEQEIRDLGYQPLLAEMLLELGKLHNERRDAEAGARALEDAVWAAELSRHEEVAAEAATILVFVTGETQLRYEVAEIWSRHAETILRRVGGHDTLWGWLFNNRGAVREKQGRLAEALDDARRAVAAKEKAGGVDSPDVALSNANVSLYLAQLGRTEEALPYVERAIRALESSLGPEHPRNSFVLLNYAELLNELGRFSEARQSCQRSLAIFERQIGPADLHLAYPLTALGLAYLGEGKTTDALSVLERAAAIRDAKETNPARLGEVHFALARALLAVGQDLPRARALTVRARDEYARALPVPIVERELATIAASLASQSMTRAPDPAARTE